MTNALTFLILILITQGILKGEITIVISFYVQDPGTHDFFNKQGSFVSETIFFIMMKRSSLQKGTPNFSYFY